MSYPKNSSRPFKIILLTICLMLGAVLLSTLFVPTVIASQQSASATELTAASAVIQPPSISYSHTVVIEDNGGDVGWNISSATINGRSAVAYYSEPLKGILYSRATDAEGEGWSTPILIAEGEYASYISLAAVNGKPAISYMKSLPSTNNSNDLYYIIAADADGDNWNSPTLVHSSSNNVGFYNSLTVIDGHPAISYYDITNRDLLYVRASDSDGGTWGSPVTVQSTGSPGSYSSLAAVNGKPAIAYYDQTTKRAMYIQASDSTGSSWNNAPVTIATTNNSGAYTSLAVIDGQPAIAYFNFFTRELKYSRANDADGNAWNSPVVAENNMDSQSVSLSLAEANGKPAIAFGSRGNDLRFSTASDAAGSSWTITLAANIPDSDINNVTLDFVNGEPAVAYYDQQGKAMYVQATNTAGTSWADEVRIDGGPVGAYLSMALINDKLSIVYIDGGNSAINFVQALDKAGSSWSTPIQLFGGQGSDSYNEFTLAEINGLPALAYYSDFGAIKYTRANDTAGTSWGVPIDVDPNALTAGEKLALLTVNGKPAIVYGDEEEINNQTFTYLMYVQATDTNGSSWGTPVQVDGSGDFQGEVDTKIINGLPAITYRSQERVKYVQANDADGLVAWKAPISVDSNLEHGRDPSLEIVSGNPAIAYIHPNTGSIRYTRATDIDGSSWPAPASFASDSAHGSLTVIDGRPVVSFWNGENQVNSLYYAQAKDSTGTSWETPIALDNGENVGSPNEILAIDDYEGGIGYHDRQNGRLKFIYIRYDKYELETVSAGNGSGTISKNPDAAVYDPGTIISVSAIADVGSTFTGWSGSGCGANRLCNITLDASKTVTATFTLNKYPLTVDTGGNGSGSVAQSPMATEYDFGTMVTLTATASVGSTFTGWSGDECIGDGCRNNGCTGTALACIVTIDEAKSITATFTLNKYALNTAISGSGSGSISRSPDAADYDFGTIVTLSATAENGSTFTGWSGAGCTGIDPCAVTVDAEKSVIATFVDDSIGYQLLLPLINNVP